MQVQAINVTEIKGVETTEDGERALIRIASGELPFFYRHPSEFQKSLLLRPQIVPALGL